MLLTNATLVLPDRLLHGTIEVKQGRIAGIQPGVSDSAGAIDCDGDFLLPGAVDLHTDNLERQVNPRTNARWPSRSALLAHDAQCAAAGVTTVFDALCVGDLGFDEDRTQTCTDGIADLDALAPLGLLKAEHFLHLRCEVPAPAMPGLLDRFADHARVRMVSLMDHTPGIGQYGDLTRYRALRRGDGDGDVEIERRIGFLQERRERLRATQRRGLIVRVSGTKAVLASHDDRTIEEVAENLADGIRVSEFPVTAEAASAGRSAGMQIIAGAPNLVRGGSHTGNIAAIDLIRAGLVDAIASDYVPCSLIEAAFVIAARHLMALPMAVALVTANPARMAGLDDRGALAPGLRADIVRLRLHDGQPVVRSVWREGERVG
jgi:alpha-D-ribose 1-methylphosphonate 5-triphosphate diphosphatase